MTNKRQRLLLTSAIAAICTLPAIASAQWGPVPGGWGGNPGWGNGAYGNGNEYANGYGRGAGRMGGRAHFCFDGDIGGMMNDFFGGNGWGNNGWGNNGWGNNGWGSNGWGNGYGRGWGKGRVCVTMDASGSMDDLMNGNGWGNNGWGNNGGGWGSPWRRGWW
jgi:hypothetical protein